MKTSLNAALVRMMTTAVFATISVIMLVNSASAVSAATCFASAQSAYEHLLAQENIQTQARDQATININRATEGELVSLNGIGSSKARAIILYRDMFGDFATIDDLTKVKGIGAKTIEKNRRRLSIRD